ncbi:hypothetical protein Scep_012727 [Stephania cephalantha]|uniref:Uncharacterized protein n=1 Tax=Stephania cephalantha TaxID=152367 RepID=A0AAP0JFM4_9MAGN
MRGEPSLFACTAITEVDGVAPARLSDQNADDDSDETLVMVVLAREELGMKKNEKEKKKKEPNCFLSCFEVVLTNSH